MWQPHKGFGAATQAPARPGPILFSPAARGSDLGCVCVGRGRQCLQTFRAPPVPCRARAHARGLCVEATQRLCGSHTGCVAATQGLLLLYNSTIGAVQQPQGLLLSYNSTIVAAEQARIRPENIESGTNGVGKPPFGLKLCAVRAVPLRMPPACLDCQKTQKSVKKHGF